MTDAELADLERICDDDEDASISTHQAVTRLIAELRLARTIRVCLNCELVGRHVESCNACGGTEFEELMP